MAEELGFVTPFLLPPPFPPSSPPPCIDMPLPPHFVLATSFLPLPFFLDMFLLLFFPSSRRCADEFLPPMERVSFFIESFQRERREER